MPAQSRVSADLKAAAGLLGVLPRGREGLLWLRYIMGERNLDWRTRAQEVLAQINSAHRQQIQLRHLPFLIRSDQTLLQLERSQLITRLRRNLARRAHHLATASFDARAKPYPQDLDHWVDKLS